MDLHELHQQYTADKKGFWLHRMVNDCTTSIPLFFKQNAECLNRLAEIKEASDCYPILKELSYKYAKWRIRTRNSDYDCIREMLDDQLKEFPSTTWYGLFGYIMSEKGKAECAKRRHNGKAERDEARKWENVQTMFEDVDGYVRTFNGDMGEFAVQTYFDHEHSLSIQLPNESARIPVKVTDFMLLGPEDGNGQGDNGCDARCVIEFPKQFGIEPYEAAVQIKNYNPDNTILDDYVLSRLYSGSAPRGYIPGIAEAVDNHHMKRDMMFCTFADTKNGTKRTWTLPAIRHTDFYDRSILVDWLAYTNFGSVWTEISKMMKDLTESDEV